MKLNTRERYIAIGVGVVVLLYIADSFFFTPELDALSQANRLIEAHQQDLQNNNGVMQNSLTARRKWKALTANHLASDASTAEVELLARVRDAAERAGLSLGQQNRSQHEKQGGFETITRRFSGEGTMARLSQFLYILDESDLPLRVVDLSVSSKKDGTDDLEIQLGIATLYDSPATPVKVTMAMDNARGVQ